jgi:hypothetical protein
VLPAIVRFVSIKDQIEFMTMAHRQAVIVLGMHRSGTSAVAGTAIRLGLAPPNTMLPPSADNPAGFHESLPVTVLNHRLLRSAGCTWDDCLSFDVNQLDGVTRAAAFDEILTILRKEFTDQPAFLMKDPRFCLTLPVWLPALRAAGAKVTVLLVIRHPEEVTRSLSGRNGFSEATVAPLWLHHVLEAERSTRCLPRAVVAYEDLLGDWRGCMARAGRIAGIAWPAGVEHERPDIDAFLNPSSRHHVAARGSADIGPPPVRGLIELAWSALQEIRHNPTAPFAPEWLDQAHATFAARRSIAAVS